MRSKTSSCWACSPLEHAFQEKCTICSPTPTPHSAIQKPNNIRPLKHMPSISSPSLERIYQQHKPSTRLISLALQDLRAISAKTAIKEPWVPPLEHNTPTLTILAENVSKGRPGISLSGPEHDHPTIELKTWNEYGGMVRDSEVLRVLLGRRYRKGKHGEGGKCKERKEET